MTLYQNCSSRSALFNKMATRVINRKKLRTTSAKPVDGCWNSITGMFLGWPSTKIAQAIPLHWTTWLPGLWIEKGFKQDFKTLSRECSLGGLLPELLKPFCSIEQHGCWSYKKKKSSTWLLLLNQWADFKTIHRKVPWVTLYQSCSNHSAPLKKMAARAKNRKKPL